MKMLWLRYAIWVTVAGLTTILLQRFKQDNIDLQRLLLELIMIQVQMFGHLLAQFLK